MNSVLLILYAYRWWIAMWIVSMAVIGIIEKDKRKAPRRGNGMMRRTTKKSINIIHFKTRSVKM